MTQILELNEKQGWVRVQPGVVLDALMDFLKDKGLFFAPNVSPSSRACIGGMIGTDACGKGSRVYGRTSQHLLELQCLLSDGSLHCFSSEGDDNKGENNYLDQVYTLLESILKDHGPNIKAAYPEMTRYLTGYNLRDIQSEKGLSLIPLIAGSEGTLAIVTEAKLRVLPLPKAELSYLCLYPSFENALADNKALLAYDPVAIESMDEHILSAIKDSPHYERALSFCPDLGESSTGALSILSFNGEDHDEISNRVKDVFTESIASTILPLQSKEASSLFWGLRKEAVGILGNVVGPNNKTPFIEDTAVPPKNGEYIEN
jgi:FAD/FMN-containing dehydrogenases